MNQTCAIPGCGRPVDEELVLFCHWHYYDLPRSFRRELVYLTEMVAAHGQSREQLLRHEARCIKHIVRKGTK